MRLITGKNSLFSEDPCSGQSEEAKFLGRGEKILFSSLLASSDREGFEVLGAVEAVLRTVAARGIRDTLGDWDPSL